MLPDHGCYPPVWSDMCENKRIEKDTAYTLFKGLYDMVNLSKIAFSKQMTLYGIRSLRTGGRLDRRQYYEWD